MEGFLDPLLRLGPERHVAMVAGALLLLFGRRLYWLAIGGLGALAAIWLVLLLEQPMTLEMQLVLAVVGVAGALLALAAQKVAVNLAGTVLGAGIAGVGTHWVQTEILLEDPRLWPLAAAAVGAFVGLFLARRLFDAALVVISSGVGAVLLAHGPTAAWHGQPPGNLAAIVLLFVFGLVVQSGRRKPPPPE